MPPEELLTISLQRDWWRESVEQRRTDLTICALCGAPLEHRRHSFCSQCAQVRHAASLRDWARRHRNTGHTAKG